MICYWGLQRIRIETSFGNNLSVSWQDVTINELRNVSKSRECIKKQGMYQRAIKVSKSKKSIKKKEKYQKERKVWRKDKEYSRLVSRRLPATFRFFDFLERNESMVINYPIDHTVEVMTNTLQRLHSYLWQLHRFQPRCQDTRSRRWTCRGKRSVEWRGREDVLQTFSNTWCWPKTAKQLHLYSRIFSQKIWFQIIRKSDFKSSENLISNHLKSLK